MQGAEYNGRKDVSLLEAILRIQGDLRRRLDPLRVTPLQAGMMLYLNRHPDAKAKETAAALAIQPPTLSPMVHTLVRKGWITNSRAPADDRAMCLRLTQAGKALARRITDRLRDVKLDLTPQKEA